MSADHGFDMWYAAKHTRIVLAPSHRLETFGNTLVNYHLISELEDFPGKVRIREGRLESHKPLVIMPNFNEITTEGLGEDARAYLEYLKANEENLRILRYGYHLKSDNFSEQVVTDSVKAGTDRVVNEVKSSNDVFAAVVRGVDNPWQVALVELWAHEVRCSAEHNIRELDANGDLFKKGMN